MDIYELIEKRRSVRAFRDDSIGEDTLKKIFEATRMAPSAHNTQDYKFIIVRDETKRKELASAASEQSFIAEAPVVVAAVALTPGYLMESGVPAYAVDVAIAMDHLTLVAAAEDLGTCWIGAFDQEQVKRILKIPAQCKVVALTPLGVARDDPGIKSRKKIKDIFCDETFI